MEDMYVVSGRSPLALQEDLETHVQGLSRLSFGPQGEWIHAEIKDVDEFSDRDVDEWRKIVIQYEDRMYSFTRVKIHPHIGGASHCFGVDLTTILHFEPKSFLN